LFQTGRHTFVKAAGLLQIQTPSLHPTLDFGELGDEKGGGGGREGEAADVEEGGKSDFAVLFSVEDIVKA
jgi:hypothetical protein